MASITGRVAATPVDDAAGPRYASPPPRGSIGRLVAVTVGAIFLLVLLIGAGGWYALGRVGDGVADGEAVSDWNLAALALESALHATAAAAQVVVDPAPHNLAAYNQSKVRLASARDAFRQARAVAGREAVVATDPLASTDAAITALDRLVDHNRAGATGAPGARLTEARGTVDGVAAALLREAEDAERATRARRDATIKAGRDWQWLALVIALLGALLGALSIAVLTRRIGPPATQLAAQLSSVAEGDLSVRTLPSAPGEPGLLGQAFQRMRASLRSVIGQMGESLQSITSAAEEFTSTSQSYAAGSAHQAAAVGEITETMARLSRTAEHIATVAVRAASVADEGRDAVDTAVAGMMDVKEKVGAAADSSVVLNQRGERVGDVADIIDEIANKTHILALNAAIEASAAGEYGRRFGVVASQIRELAGETQRATAQVKSIVAEIRESTQAIAAASADANEVANRGATLGERARAAIQNIVSTVHVIADATQQQRNASTEMAETMRTIADVAHESAAGSQQAATNAMRVARTAGELQALVARFRLDPDARPRPPTPPR